MTKQNVRERAALRRAVFLLPVLATIAFAATPAPASDAQPPLAVAQAEKPSGEGVIKAVDRERHKLLLAHGPIAALNWPGMTMDFVVAPDVDLASLEPGKKIGFTLSATADGDYVIDRITVRD